MIFHVHCCCQVDVVGSPLGLWVEGHLQIEDVGLK